jgi:GNAT superfamily N-acetyltransferase
MLKIKKATAKDIPMVLSFIRQLAEYEREPEAVLTTEKDLQRDGFGREPKFQAVIARWDDEPVGMAFYFYNYSTWKGRPGIYLEDIIIRPEFRGRGIGKALMAYLARVAVAKKCFGIRWEVLDWNKSGIGFYKELGAEFREHWQSMRIQGRELQRLARTGASS